MPLGALFDGKSGTPLLGLRMLFSYGSELSFFNMEFERASYSGGKLYGARGGSYGGKPMPTGLVLL